MTTTFNLTFRMPNSSAESTALSTCLEVSVLLVMNSFFAGTRLSRLMLRWVSPASLSLPNFLFIRLPFVVMPTWPGKWFDMSATMSIISRRTRGSPPVSLTFWTPWCLNMRAIRSSSVLDKICCYGLRGTPSAGMQYCQTHPYYQLYTDTYMASQIALLSQR